MRWQWHGKVQEGTAWQLRYESCLGTSLSSRHADAPRAHPTSRQAVEPFSKLLQMDNQEHRCFLGWCAEGA
eukprot:2730751-Prorocentrum_lima.AAC.1